MHKPAYAAIVLALAGVAQQAPSAPAVDPTAEFPPQDYSLVFNLAQGLSRRAAAPRLKEAPADVETVRALARAEDMSGVLRSLRLIVDRHPERIADAAEAARETGFRLRGNDQAALDNRAAMRQILVDARARLASLPREDAARAERVFVVIDGELAERRTEWRTRLERFIEQYRGTRAALLSEVDLIESRRVSQSTMDALDRLIAEHPGSEVAAKALYQKGFQWHTINTLGTLEPRNADPTARFLRVLDIVKELQSGKYPRSEWTEKAPSLITGFFIPSGAPIAPDNVDLLIRHLTDFARANFVLSERAPDQDGIGYVVTTKIGDLYDRKGERVAGVERTLDALEASVREAESVRLLRALFYLRAASRETAEARTARVAKARGVLAPLSAAGSSLPHRRALATLASLEFEERQYPQARAAFERYAAAYPSSAWTWVARIRTGQCFEAESNASAAVQAYLAAAERHPDVPLARVLGAEYAARVYELGGEFDKALPQHERALAAWDNSFGPVYSTYVRRSPAPAGPLVPTVDQAVVRRDELEARIEQLKITLGQPGGALLERGRALLERGRFDAATEVLTSLRQRHPTSPLVGEARTLAARALIETALAAADVQGAQPDADRALKILDGIPAEPVDASTTISRMMRSALLVRAGKRDEAREVLAAALAAWSRKQPEKLPATALERDVAAIRKAVFLPRGGHVYSTGRWNAFRWARSSPPFMIVNRDLRVKLADGNTVKVSLAERAPDVGQLLFFQTDELALLNRMLYAIGGTRRREPGHVMETPNQPVGDAMRILRLWAEFFPARPGHWGGWELETYPVITEIHFADADRTRAAAKVTIGYSGATVELEKENGVWIAKRLTSQWIT